MGLDLELLRKAVVNEMYSCFAGEEYYEGADGLVFHVDKHHTAKMILRHDEKSTTRDCHPEKTKEAARREFEIARKA